MAAVGDSIAIRLNVKLATELIRDITESINALTGYIDGC